MKDILPTQDTVEVPLWRMYRVGNKSIVVSMAPFEQLHEENVYYFRHMPFSSLFLYIVYSYVWTIVLAMVSHWKSLLAVIATESEEKCSKAAKLSLDDLLDM